MNKGVVADGVLIPRGDNGVHTFPGGVMLVTLGDRTLTAADTASGIYRQCHHHG